MSDKIRGRKFSALWLPCGIQNFEREPRNFKALRLPSEAPLMDRLKRAWEDDEKAFRAPSVNLRFKWYPVAEGDTEWCYFDSDGFICAISSNGGDPRLPQLADDDYRVNRSGEPGKNWSDDWLLTAFQANLLFEGIWNSAFDPAVFLLTNKKRKNDVETAFTFGELSESVIVDGEFQWSIDTQNPLPWQLRANIMAQAIRSFRDDHLLPLKWNIEAARRRLYGETMTLLHRQENLHQFAVIYSRHGGGDTILTRDSLFINTSDEQLRGYVSLISAKMPLIENLTYLAEDTVHNIRYAADASEPEATNETDQDRAVAAKPVQTNSPMRDVRPNVLAEIVHSWHKLVDAVGENVVALERSFEAVWRDSMYQETEQVRIEEEALGELQREASQESEGRWLDTLLFVITFGVTAAALVDAVTHGGESQGSGSGIQKIVSHHNPYIVPLIIVAGISLVIYLVAAVSRKLAHGFVPRYEQVTRLDEQIWLQSRNQLPNNGDGARRPSSAQAPHIDFEWDPEIVTEPMSLHRRRPWRLGVGRLAENALQPLGISNSPDIGFAILPHAEFQRARLDTPSEADSILRLHAEFTFLMSRVRKHRIPVLGRMRFRLMPLVVFYYLTGWFYRLVVSASQTFPIRRADIQCVVELHRHWPDPGARAMLFVREIRVIVVSRKHMSLSENAALLHFVDSVVLQHLLPDYQRERQAQARTAQASGRKQSQPLARDGQESFRDRPLRLSLLSDRIFAFDQGEEITFVVDPVASNLPDAAATLKAYETRTDDGAADVDDDGAMMTAGDGNGSAANWQAKS